MAKRYKTRLLKKHHSYSVEEAAEVLGAHPQTIRAWEPKGLRILKTQTPHLILGIDLAAFLNTRENNRKQKLGPDQLYCLKCKAACVPDGRLADFIAHGAEAGRLSGICPRCEGMCHRFVSKDQLRVIAPNLAIMRPA